MKDPDDHAVRFTPDERERLIRGLVAPRLLEEGLICRADDRVDPVDPAVPGADLRAGRVRRDRVHTARGPDRGTEGVARMTSTVGVPTEVKDSEHRVALTPDGVRELVHHDVRVLVAGGRGQRRRHHRQRVRAARARRSSPMPRAVWAEVDLVCKVKEPQEAEYALPARRLVAVHVPAPRRVPRGGQGAAALTVHCGRVRDGADRATARCRCSRR